MEQGTSNVERQRVIGKKELRELTNVSYQTWWRMETAGLAPKRIRLSAGRVGWNLGQVLDWLSNREAV